MLKHLSKGIKRHSFYGRLPLNFLFSNSVGSRPKLILSQIAQKAIWASKIIQFIKQAPQQQSIFSPSLREKLINLRIDQDKYQLDDNVRLQVLNMFIKGIRLSPVQHYEQERITSAVQKSQKQTLDNFIFCPNVLVTKQMFNYLGQMYNYLVVGNFGSSKTIGIILYRILSQYIIKYRYQQDSMFQDLVNQGLIDTSVPKILYWNVDENSINQSSLKQIALQQTPEIKDKTTLKIHQTAIDKLGQNIKWDYYMKGIKIKVVIDQINYAASLARRWNRFLSIQRQKKKKINDNITQLQKEIQQVKSQIQKQNKPELQRKLNLLNNLYYLQHQKLVQNKQNNKFQYDTNFKSLKKPLLKFSGLIKQFQTFGIKHLYNSSINIETQYISDTMKKQEEDQIYFQIGHKSNRFSIMQINFHSKIKDNWGLYDFFKFFWFQIERNTFLINSQGQLIQKFKLLFYNQCLSFKAKGFWRFLFIRQFFIVEEKRQNSINRFLKSKQNFSSEDQKQEIRQYFRNILIRFDIFCEECSYKSLQKFINKQQDKVIKRETFIRILYKLAKQLKRKSINVLSFKKQILQNLMGIKKIEQFLDSSSNNKEQISLQYKSTNQMVQFHLTPQQFIKVAKPIIQKRGINQNTPLVSQINIDMMKKDQSLKGKYVQLLLLNILASEVKLILQNIHQKKQIYHIFKKSLFRPFNSNIKENQQKSIQSNFEQMLALAQENNQKDIFGTPYKIQKKEKKQGKKQEKVHINNSRCFDFVIIKYLKDKKRFLINTFDLSVAQSQYGKTEQFVRLMDEIVNKPFSPFYSQCEFQIKHTIICFKNLCLAESQYNKQKNSQIKSIKITYSSFEDMDVEAVNPQNELGAMQFMDLHQCVLNIRKS